MTLAETQALFHAALTGGPVEPGALEGCFAGTAPLPAAERVAIYADMYRSRLEEALGATYPNLRRLLGPERFGALAGDYLASYPSQHHDIAQVGRRLAAFLRDHPDGGEGARPDLADLAELEWLRQGCFFAPPAEPVGPAAFAGLSPRAFVAATLALSPALRVGWLARDVTPLWRALEAGEPAPPPADETAAVAVWRTGFEVAHARLDPDEAVALARAAAGEPLGAICEAFAGRPEPAAAAHQALAGWLGEGWVAAVVAPA